MSSGVDLSILDAMTEEQREAFYLKLREERLAAGKKEPRTPRKSTTATGIVQVIARGNDNARAALANERTTARLAETYADWIWALQTYAKNTNLELPPAAEYDSAESYVTAVIALLPEDIQTRLTSSRESARQKMEDAKVKIEQKLKGRNTQAEGRAKRNQTAEAPVAASVESGSEAE